jgi:hypothetical protein
MPQTLLEKAKGLVTSPNTLGGPLGAFVQADNMDIDEQDVVSIRRGFSLERPLPDAADRGRRQVFYQSNWIVARTAGVMARWTGSAWSDYSGTFDHPDSNRARLRFVEAASNLYALTATGVKILDAPTGSWQSAGIPRGLDASGALSGSSSWFTSGNQVAYRHVWVYKDANSNIKKGVPSGRLVLTNTSGSATNVDLTVSIPTGITTSWYLQTYRSSLSGGSTVVPSDELFLCNERQPSSGEISAGTLTFTDSQPSSLLGELLYTSPSRGGLAVANAEPPLAWDACRFKSCVFYANVTGKHQLVVTLLGTGGSALIANDTITVGGTTYTAKGTETIASAEFKVYTGGTAAQDIADTAASLIRVINRYSGSTVYATYQSGVSEAPGKILLFERGLGSSAFAVTSSRGSAFTPTLPSAGTTVSSSNDRFQDAVMISKTGEPEAVPAGYIRRVGSPNFRTLRVLPLRDALLVFKEDGIFRITGSDPTNFQVDEHDGAILLAPDTAVVLNNAVRGLFDQGICSVSENGAVKLSTPIRGQLLSLDPTSDGVRFKSFGCAYESDGKYFLWTVEADTDTECTQAFVFNASNDGRWTRRPISATAALVSPVDDKMYLFDGDTSNARIERKDREYTDYYDAAYAVTLNSSSGTTVYLSSTENAEEGDILYVSADEQALITEVQAAYVVVDTEVTWTPGAAEIRKGIDVQLEFAPFTSGNPGKTAQYPEISLFFRTLNFYTLELSFASDRSPFFEAVTITGAGSAGWGLPAWGDGPFGGDASDKPKRKLVPRNKQRCSQLRVRLQIREAYATMELLGLSLPARDTGSTKVGT